MHTRNNRILLVASSKRMIYCSHNVRHILCTFKPKINAKGEGKGKSNGLIDFHFYMLKPVANFFTFLCSNQSPIFKFYMLKPVANFLLSKFQLQYWISLMTDDVKEKNEYPIRLKFLKLSLL